MPFYTLGQVGGKLRAPAETGPGGSAGVGLTFLRPLSLYKQALISLFVKLLISLF